MILYFSASGNSRFIAETAGEMLSDKLVCLNDRIKKQDFSETKASPQRTQKSATVLTR